MRIACVHVPQFALQSLSRIDPSLRGAAVAVVGAGHEPAAGMLPQRALHSPIVVACSRAAWSLGVRLGMTAGAARFVSPELRVVAADASLERETVRAIADALLGVSAVVDTGGRVAAGGTHLAMYCEVPSKTRGTTFGERLLALLETFGVSARIGIADDRFTAWVAAAHGGVEARDPGDATRRARHGATAPRDDRGVINVPRGGSAAFLAPCPLSLLAITPEVQHMLEALGVRTLGEFAALPAPSVSRPLEADYQALARGDGGNALRPYAPEAPIREELVVRNAGGLFGGATAVAALAERVGLRLQGRARRAARFEVTITGEDGERVVPVTAGRATSSQGDLVELIAPLVGERPGAIGKLGVVVVGEAIADVAGGAEGDMAGPPIDALSAALAGAGTAMPPLAPLGHLAPLAPGRGQAWQLSAPRPLAAAPRDAHRRTRRARQRARTVTLAQSPLFGNLDG
jgi:impB/mucB/samB family protein